MVSNQHFIQITFYFIIVFLNKEVTKAESLARAPSAALEIRAMAASTIEIFLEKHKDLLRKVSYDIWKNPELCFQERFAHDLLTAELEKFGFEVRRGYFFPTAFRAEYDSGRAGPTIAAICEYDALPGIGHACGHNLMAELGLGVGLAVQAAMKADETVTGKIVVMGTPAEEGGGGKIHLIERGAFYDVDAAVLAHPQSVNRLYPLIVECEKVIVRFTSDPDVSPWESLTAMDAAVTCYNNIAILRKSIKDTWRISLTFPDCSPADTKVHFMYRAPNQQELKTLEEKILNCVNMASQATGCVFQIKSKRGDRYRYRGMMYNKTMVELFGKHARAMGVEFHDNDPKYVESAVSTDMGNLSQVVPGMQPEFFIGARPPHVNHTPGFATAAASEVAQDYTLVIVEAMAKTVVELMSDRKLMAKVEDEFAKNPQRDPDSYERKAGNSQNYGSEDKSANVQNVL